MSRASVISLLSPALYSGFSLLISASIFTLSSRVRGSEPTMSLWGSPKFLYTLLNADLSLSTVSLSCLFISFFLSLSLSFFDLDGFFSSTFTDFISFITLSVFSCVSISSFVGPLRSKVRLSAFVRLSGSKLGFTTNASFAASVCSLEGVFIPIAVNRLFTLSFFVGFFLACFFLSTGSPLVLVGLVSRVNFLSGVGDSVRAAAVGVAKSFNSLTRLSTVVLASLNSSGEALSWNTNLLPFNWYTPGFLPSGIIKLNTDLSFLFLKSPPTFQRPPSFTAVVFITVPSRFITDAL